MTKPVERELTLHEPAGYQVKVPGHLDEGWVDWVGAMTVTFEGEEKGTPVTVLTGTVDQAALQGLLRQLYALGLPLLSVNRIEPDQEDALDVT